MKTNAAFIVDRKPEFKRKRRPQTQIQRPSPSIIDRKHKFKDNTMGRASDRELDMLCCRVASIPDFLDSPAEEGIVRSSVSSTLAKFDSHLGTNIWYDESVLDRQDGKANIWYDESVLDRQDGKVTGFGFNIVECAEAHEIMQATHVMNGKHVSIKRTILVCNLSREVTEERFMQFFSGFGQVVMSEVLHKGCAGFVIFDSDADADALLAKKEIMLDGQMVELKAATINRSEILPPSILHEYEKRVNCHYRCSHCGKRYTCGHCGKLGYDSEIEDDEEYI